MKVKILVVDDEPQILKVLKIALAAEGYEIMTAQDGEEAVQKALTLRPDLIVLDLMLPTLDGFEVCQKVKAQTDIPIIILSAKGDEVDKIVGFKMGVDDYQTKPFSPSEFVLRVKAILRRSQVPKDDQPKDKLAYPGLEINRTTRAVVVYGQKAELTAKEFDLLWLLAARPGQVFTRMMLLEQIWGSSFPGDENTVSVHIRRLREKIEKNPSKPAFIITVWGVGYKFEKNNLPGQVG